METEFIHNLDEKDQIKLAIELIEIGLPVWTEYASVNKIDYNDSVVGMYHKVNKNLISKSIKIFKNCSKNNGLILKKYNEIRLKLLLKEYLEPRVALIDEDFGLPKNVELIFLSAYYLTEFLTGKKQSGLDGNNTYVSIRYSIDSITDDGIKTELEIKNILDEYCSITTEKLNNQKFKNIEEIIEFIKVNKNELKISLYKGASELEIFDFEEIEMKLPDDIKKFYSFTNGFESAEDLFRIIPLDEIIEKGNDDYLISNTSFHIAEYMTYCDMWSVNVDSTNNNEYEIYNKADDIVKLTNSFVEFLEVFLNGGVFENEGLYDWRKNINN
ncbi:MAG: SMI1/KNR4 family protein [Algibacter sp.]